MKYIALVALLAMGLMGCDRQDTKNGNHKNVRDHDSHEKPMDQSETEEDRAISKRIKEVIIEDDTLSDKAKNIKIVTIRGVVLLKGPVSNSSEREIIIRKISTIRGVNRVDSQLEVVQDNK